MRYLLLVFVLVACQSAEENEIVSELDQKAIPMEELSLHEPSGLASLMRIMEAHADSSLLAVRSGAGLPPFPRAIDSLITATPTKDMHIDSETFPAFAKNYIDQVKALYSVPAEQQMEQHDMLVQSCANCHYAHCPGPLAKINKLFAEPLD